VIARKLQVLMGAATLGALLWSVSAGSAVASASTRLRSGAVRAQLVSHVSAGTSAGISLTGSGVMAAVVGALALFAVAFLVVTLIRRRITPA
jgi:hypothetical protein